MRTAFNAKSANSRNLLGPFTDWKLHNCHFMTTWVCVLCLSYNNCNVQTVFYYWDNCITKHVHFLLFHDCSFPNNIVWSTVSNALFKSKNTPTTFFRCLRLLIHFLPGWWLHDMWNVVYGIQIDCSRIICFHP